MINRISQLALLSVVGMLTGCSTLPTQFGGTWPLPAERESSAALDLGRPVVTPQPDGGLVIVGYLTKQFGAATTTQSHIDVAFLTAEGKVLRLESVDFTPRDLAEGSMRSRPSARYEIRVAALPAGTARIKVAGHDEPHARS